MAVDANGDIILAGTTSASATMLNADSTAVALARIALGPLTNNVSGSAADAAIHANPNFAPLISAVSSALISGGIPGIDPTVLNALVTLINSGATAKVANVSLEHIKSVQRPAITGGLPFTVISGIFSVSIPSSATGTIDLRNAMPIPWTASPSDVSGAPLSAGVSLPAAGIHSSTDTDVTADNRGFNLTVMQTPEQQLKVLTDIAEAIIKTALDFVPSTTCNFADINATVKAQVANIFHPSSDTWSLVQQSFKNFFSPTNSVDILASCSTGAIKTFLSPINELVTLISKIKTVVVDGGEAAILSSWEGVYWDKSYPIGICESVNWQVVNCAADYTFKPASIFLAPHAQTTVTLSATDAMHNDTLLPAGLTYQPANNTVSIDANSLLVTANSLGNTNIEVTDQEGTATGYLVTEVANPQISPATSTIALGSGFASIVTLKLTDSQGNALILPPGVTWTSSDTSNTSLGNLTLLTNTGTTSWAPPTGAVPGTVIITALDPAGNPYSTATITVTGCVTTDLACKLAGKWLDSFEGNLWTINSDGLTGTFEIFVGQPSPCYNVPLPVTVQLSGSDSFMATALLGPSNGVDPCNTTWADSLTLDSSGLIAQGTFSTGINHGLPTTWTKASGSVVAVPNVLGYDQTHAQSTFALANLTVGSVTTQVSTTGPFGVISESPPIGSSVASGSAINLIIATR